MRKALPTMRKKLAEAGFESTDIKYIGAGRKLLCIGFRIENGNRTITVEPVVRTVWGKLNTEYFTSFNAPHIHYTHHYSRFIGKEKYMPGLCRPFIKMREDIINFLNK